MDEQHEQDRVTLDITYACGGLKVTTRPDSRSTGPRAHVTGMIDGFRSLGHKVTQVIVGDHVPTRLSAAGHGDMMRSGTVRGRLTDGVRLAAGPATGLWARLASNGADLLYERQATYQSAGSFRRRGVPWVVESNGPFWYEATKERGALSFPRLAKQMELSAYRRADMVVAVSEHLKDVLVSAGGAAADDVLVVPNAVAPDRFARPRVERPEGEDLVVGFVGHVIGWAGLPHLVEGTARARARGVRVRARVIGEGPALRALEDQVRQRGAGQAVELLGYRSWDDIPDLLATCDAAFSGQVPMAIGSMYHSPLKLYEYSAAGLPVIATDFPDARTLVEGAGHGWLIEPGDDEGIADALEELDARRHELPAMRAAVRDHVVSRHTWGHRAASIIDELARRGLVGG